MRKYRPAFYGLTGATDAYIKEHGLKPDSNGCYPRLPLHDEEQSLDDLDKEIENAKITLLKLLNQKARTSG